MRVFALDSSFDSGFSTIVYDGRTVTLHKEFNDVKFTENFFSLLEKNKRIVEDINLFIVNTGPGSYTGIRAGIAALKGIAISYKQEVLGVSKFDVIARKFFIKNTQLDFVNVFLKSYNPNYLYHQDINSSLNAISNPKKIAVSEITRSVYYPIVSDVAICNSECVECSALDLVEFIQSRIDGNQSLEKFIKLNPIYI